MAEDEKQIQGKPEKMTDLEKKRNRHPVIYILSVILLIVIAVTFVGAPVIDDAVTRGDNAISFGKYGDKDIEFAQGNFFSRQREIIGQQINHDQNGNSQNWKWEAYQVWRGAFERTVVHTGMLSECETNKTFITDDQLNKVIIEGGPFTVNGEFDVDAYEETPSYKKQEIRRDFRENTLKEYYLTDYIYGNKTSDQESDMIMDILKNQRTFQLVFFPFDRISDDEVKAYGEKNKNLFRKVGLAKITLDSESDAKAVLKQLKDDPNAFSDIAKNQSKDVYADNGGDMGMIYYYSLKDEFQDDAQLNNVFGLAKDGISGIVKSGDSFLIYKCTAPAVDANLDSVDAVTTIKSYMNRFERGIMEDKAMKVAEDFRVNAAKDGIYQAASLAGVSVYETEPFGINYGGFNYFSQIRLVQGDLDIRSAQYNKDFFIQAFSVNKDEYTKPVILDRGVVVLKYIDEKVPEDDLLATFGLYYPQIQSQYAQNDIAVHFLKSDKLKDNFVKTFDKYFKFE